MTIHYPHLFLLLLSISAKKYDEPGRCLFTILIEGGCNNPPPDNSPLVRLPPDKGPTINANRNSHMPPECPSGRPLHENDGATNSPELQLRTPPDEPDHLECNARPPNKSGFKGKRATAKLGRYPKCSSDRKLITAPTSPVPTVTNNIAPTVLQ